MTAKIEREKQAADSRACNWVVYPKREFFAAVGIVQCRAATEGGVYRVAAAEHPGVPFISASPGRMVKS